jgi:hypothetical protein
VECGFLAGEPDDNAYGDAPRSDLEKELEQLRASRFSTSFTPQTSQRPLKNGFGESSRPLFGSGSKN